MHRQIAFLNAEYVIRHNESLLVNLMYVRKTEADMYATDWFSRMKSHQATRAGNMYVPEVYLDCANGVGAQKFPRMYISQSTLVVTLINDQLTSLNDQVTVLLFLFGFYSIESYNACSS